jgi:putative aldouronate transport system substrate-binding protein
MKKTSKSISLPFFCILLLILFIGCGDKKVEVSVVQEEALVDDPSAKLQLDWLGSNPALEDNSWGELQFEELFNVDVKIIRAPTEEQRTTLFASGDIPDYISVDTIAQVATLQRQGILSPISIEEIKKYMPTHYQRGTELDPTMFNYSIIDGQNWAIPFIDVTGSLPRGTAIIRADWLEAVGITKVPTSITELETAFIAFREKDPDRNGRKDTYALTAPSEPANNIYFFSPIFGAYGVNPFMWREKSDGTLEYGFTTDDCKEALLLLNKWYKMELIDPEFITDLRRTSGRDTVSKFANGNIGILYGLSANDYQWDNDGHASAKWMTAHPEILNSLTKDGDISAMFELVNTTDFTDKLPKPYYIVIPKIDGPQGKRFGYVALTDIRGYAVFGSPLVNDPAKRHRIMTILEREENEEDIYINHHGPDGSIWKWNDDHTERIYNPNFADNPLYHPQGQLLGVSYGLWPMYMGNRDFLMIFTGGRQKQRYEFDYPIFEALPKMQDKVLVALPSATENPELVGGMIKDYLVKAIRGDVDINATWDATVAAWKRAGGDTLTKEANDWYASIK